MDDKKSPAIAKRDPNRIGAGKPGPGRPKGKPNKINAEIREMIREALEEAGGTEYLVRQAEENPRAFLALVARIVPAHVSVDATLTLADLVGQSFELERERQLADGGAPS